MRGGYSAPSFNVGEGLAMANFPRTAFAGAGDARVATPAAPPGDWHVSSTLPPIDANRPTLDSLKQGENPTVTVSKYDANAAVKPDVLVKADGNVEYAKGFTGNLANINVAFEDGAKAEKVQSVAYASADLQQQSKEGVLPQLKDDSGGLLTDQFKKDFKEQYSTPPPPEPNGGNNDGGKKPDNNRDEDKPDGQNDDTTPTPNPDSKFDGKKQAHELINEYAKSAGFLDGNVYGDKLMSAIPGGLQGMINAIGHPPPFTKDEIEAYLKQHQKEIADNLKKQAEEATAAGDKDGAAAITKLADSMGKPEFAQGLANVINGSGLKTQRKDGHDVLTPDSKLNWSKEAVQSLLPHDTQKPGEDVISAFNRSAMRQAAAKDADLTKLLEKESPSGDAGKAHAKLVSEALQALITKLKGKDASDLLK